MIVAAGTRLGPYEILFLLGAGGMGEVWKARDTRLDRSVAIKILPADFAQNAQLRIRFEREAKTISKLNHPNICTLFDVGHENGTEYLVMELLEGQSLADRLRKGSLPFTDVLKYGVQIGEALDKAHSAGIVHRDLKPDNVMLTKAGAKLLDFGLAKTQAIVSGPNATTQKPVTKEGTILGTLPYMSPEQLDGLESDARTDIFAFGALLYEMATGNRAFEGKTQSSLIAAIASSEPKPISAIQPLTPPAFEHVVTKCLAKKPDDRWQSAHDIAEELRWIGEISSTEVTRARPTSRRSILMSSAYIILGLAIGAATARILIRPPANQSTELSITIPSGLAYDNSSFQSVAISRDGTQVAYIAGPSHRLFLRRLNHFDAREVTDDAAAPFFSPDGNWLGYYRGPEPWVLERVPVTGGAPVPLADDVDPFGAVWVGDDSIYRVGRFEQGIFKQTASGNSVATAVVTPATVGVRGMRALLWPDYIPQANALLLTGWTGGELFDDAKIVVHSLSTGENVILPETGTCARWLPAGYIVYGSGFNPALPSNQRATLMAVPFDAKELRVTGPPQPAIPGTAMGVANGEVHFASARNGTVVFAPGSILDRKRSLVQIDLDGREVPLPVQNRPYGDIELSPDRRWLATQLEKTRSDIWKFDLSRDLLEQVSGGGDEFVPTWSPKGIRLFWSSTRNGHAEIYSTAPDGTGEQRITHSASPTWVSSVSPDGTTLLATAGQGSARRLVQISVDGGEAHPLWPASPTAEDDPDWSPDGKWVVYTSYESESAKVYARRFPGGADKSLVSANGHLPIWSRDGKRIYFLSGATTIMSVNVDTRKRFSADKARAVYSNPNLYKFALGLDDTHLIVVKDIPSPPITELHVMTNWTPRNTEPYR